MRRTGSRKKNAAARAAFVRRLQKVRGNRSQAQFARELVYSDGVDLKNLELAVPVGVTCRMCERTDCEQRAHPSLRHPLAIDANVRRVSLYAPTEGR